MRDAAPLSPPEREMLRTVIRNYPCGLHHDGARALAEMIGGVSHQTLWNAVSGKPVSGRVRARIMAHWDALVAQYGRQDTPFEDLTLEEQLRRQGVPEERIKVVLHYLNRAIMAAVGALP